MFARSDRGLSPIATLPSPAQPEQEPADMHQQPAIHPLTCTCLLLCLLAACGGSDRDPAPVTPLPVQTPSAQTPSAQMPAPPAVVGVFGGTITRASQPELLFVARDDGTHLGIYGTTTSGSFNIGGYVFSGGDWWSSPDPTVYNGVDWGRGGLSVYVDASYDVAIPSLSGTIKSATETVAFAGGPIPGSSYNYNTPATVAAVVANWSLTDQNGARATLDVAVDGSVTGQYLGCSLTGNVKPNSSGKNVLDLRLSFDKTICPANWYLLDLPYDGFAVAYPVAEGHTQLIVWAETNNGVDWSLLLAAGTR
jgi:hypothetical protein